MAGSVVIRRSIGRQLKALRLAARKTQADVAAVASAAKLKRMESGQVAQRMADVRTLCFMYGADEATTERLAELSLLTTEAGWWEDHSDAVPSWFAMYAELEAAATRLFTYDPELVHGLLQTPDYHRALAVVESEIVPGADVEQQVEMRGRRQRSVFHRTLPLRLTVVLSAGAVDRQIGGPAVAAAQRAHLLTVPAEVRVLPAEVATKVTGSLDRFGCWDAAWTVPTSSAITQARKRLGRRVFAELFERMCGPVAGRTGLTAALTALGTARGSFLRGWRLLAIDGEGQPPAFQPVP